MRAFQGQNPETKGVHTCKPWTEKWKLCQLPDSVKDVSKQPSIYNPEITRNKQTNIDHSASPSPSSKKPRYGYGTVLPSFATYTVECASCHKWRIVPTKEKYEELRGSISQEPFVCARACGWNRGLSCDEPEDMSLDESRVWAFDKPNIAQPPPGWYREVRIRQNSSKFADVYYTSPSGKRLRSLVEIGRYLAENPHYIREGVNLSQFSFAIPKPLKEGYVWKRTFGDAPESLELHEVDQATLKITQDPVYPLPLPSLQAHPVGPRIRTTPITKVYFRKKFNGKAKTFGRQIMTVETTSEHKGNIFADFPEEFVPVQPLYTPNFQISTKVGS